MQFSDYQQQCAQRIEPALAAIYTDNNGKPLLQGLEQAINYSLLAGGKRVRPLLVYGAAQAVSGVELPADIDTIAAAVECIHCYSLIHDDLPAMDDDDLRRGLPTNHVKFDEATAILAGDALNTLAFELLANLPTTTSVTKVSLIQQLTAAAGTHGMVGGQFIDLQAADKTIDLDHLQTMHRLKTGALIESSVMLGAISANANADQLQALNSYAQHIGLAFQIVDDLLDIESTTEQLGKQQGADIAHNKPTFPALMGLEQAKQEAQNLHQQALTALAGFGDNALPLRHLADYIIERKF